MLMLPPAGGSLVLMLVVTQLQQIYQHRVNEPINNKQTLNKSSLLLIDGLVGLMSLCFLSSRFHPQQLHLPAAGGPILRLRHDHRLRQLRGLPDETGDDVQ